MKKKYDTTFVTMGASNHSMGERERAMIIIPQIHWQLPYWINITYLIKMCHIGSVLLEMVL